MSLIRSLLVAVLAFSVTTFGKVIARVPGHKIAYFRIIQPLALPARKPMVMAMQEWESCFAKVSSIDLEALSIHAQGTREGASVEVAPDNADLRNCLQERWSSKVKTFPSTWELALSFKPMKKASTYTFSLGKSSDVKTFQK